MTIINICNRIIEYSFYALFFLVPLVIASDTSELFEFNKMWLTFSLTLIIAGAWLTKMIRLSRIWFQRTLLDIPILLFLASQFISTIFSWDAHISFWGYYSRFNGGFLSILTYIFLYYAFVSNLAVQKIVKRSLFVSLASGLIVALWGIPSHFGHDPTCFLFRHTFDVSCWTEDFQPRVRIFSTLGQPAWLAAYLAILLPISIAFAMKNSKSQAPNLKQYPMTKNQNTKQKGFENSNLKNWNLFGIWNLKFCAYLLLSVLFYLDLLYTQARAGIIAAWLSLAFFVIMYLLAIKRQFLNLSVILLVLFSITFFIGTPFSQISKFTFEGMKAHPAIDGSKNKIENPTTPPQHFGELGGTDSGKIRSIVWKGAIEIWKNNPIFGTGVETFAFAYYRYKLPAHNLLSEWNFLYNKAHNEYLNYLATAGAFGLGTYLLMIGWFFVRVIPKCRDLNSISNKTEILKQSMKQVQDMVQDDKILTLALLAGYISILITNFFGFSVVITNIYLFMIPAFAFILAGILNPENVFVFPLHKTKSTNVLSSMYKVSTIQWVCIFILILAIFYSILTLLRFWNADKNYAYGYNLDRAGEYLKAYPYLHKAVEQRNEPVFKDELAVNDAMLAIAMLSQKDSAGDKKELIAKANNLAQEAIDTSNRLTTNHENNVVFWKTRVRIFYTLSQVDPRYLALALKAIQKAAELAPNDASISYNLGVLYGQNNDIKNAIEVLANTIKLKPNYQDAQYALGLFYHQEAIDKDGRIVNSALQKKAIERMQYIIDHFPNNSGAKDALKAWAKE